MAFPLERFGKVSKISSVGSTNTGAANTGKGLGARVNAIKSVAQNKNNSKRTRALMENALSFEPINANTQKTQGGNVQSDMDVFTKVIQEETEIPEVKGAEVSEVKSSKNTTSNINLSELAEKLAETTNDPNFISAVKNLAKKHNTTPNKIYGIINGESAWDPTASNAGGYKSLFALGVVASEEAGIDYDNLTTMSPSEQVAEYGKYLDRWNYDGSVSLGLMQAAPGLAKKLKGSPVNTVVYAKDSPEWNANPGWRSAKDGDITLASIDAYYNKGK